MIRVLVVDDSALVRSIFEKELNKERDIKVIATAADPYIAREKLVHLKPDVITLDVEMPRMDGITFLKKIMVHMPTPVIIVSSLTKAGGELALKALEYGAVEVMAKPGSSFTVRDMVGNLADKIRSSVKANLKTQKEIKQRISSLKEETFSLAKVKATDKIIAIGASTGGTEAIKEVIRKMPENTPGIVIVQHMPPQFTKAFADRLNGLCRVEVLEADNNNSVIQGKALIAPGNYHMLLKRSGARYFVSVKSGPRVHHQRPAVDVLFNSVAKYAGKNAIGVLLTGMGADGAKGLLSMKEAGAKTIVQDEKSSVVFGMPKEAIKMNAADYVESLENISKKIISLL